MEKKYPFLESRKRPLGRSERLVAKRRHLHISDAASESDKDSGFSDGSSESLGVVEQMDLEEGLTSPPWSRCTIPHHDQTVANSSFTPVPLFVMRNFFIEQAKNISPKINAWPMQSIEMIPAPSQLVFLQSAVPPIANPSSVPSKKNCHSSYLPKVESYAKIAPHPSKKTAERSPSTPLDKRLCSAGNKQNLTSETCQINESDAEVLKNKSSKSEVILPCTSKTAFATNQSKFPPATLDGTVLTSAGSRCLIDSPLKKILNLSEVCQAEYLLKSASQSSEENVSAMDHLSTGQTFPAEDARPESQWTLQQNKQRRFQNTLDILHKSGLLGITLKTKELAHQNQVTQHELELLKKQTELFLKAAQSNDPELQAKLLMSMSVPFDNGGVTATE